MVRDCHVSAMRICPPSDAQELASAPEFLPLYALLLPEHRSRNQGGVSSAGYHWLLYLDLVRDPPGPQHSRWCDLFRSVI